ADLEEAQRQFLSGKYHECIREAEKRIEQRSDSDDWQLLLSEALLMTGKYREARSAITNALAQESRNLRLRWAAREVLLSNGETEAANQLVEQIIQRATASPWAYRDAPNFVVLGQALLLRGLDPKRVLDTVFENARKLDPKL